MTTNVNEIEQRLYAKANLLGLAGVDEFDAAQAIKRLREALEPIFETLERHKSFYAVCEDGTEMPKNVSVPIEKLDRAYEALRAVAAR